MKKKNRKGRLCTYRNICAVFCIIGAIIGKTDVSATALIISAVADMLMIAIDNE